MRVWIITKHRLIIFIFAILILVGLILGFAGVTVPTGKIERKLPIYAVKTEEKKIAITFDAAWSNQDTQKLIEVLKKHKAKATFFIVGDWAKRFPESVKAFFDAGHEIANHSDTHKAFSKCTYAELRREMADCNEKLEKITGKKVALVRAPSGDYTNQSIDVAKELNMLTIQWDVDSLDYTKIPVEEIVNRVLSRVQNGSIVLFHNGVDNTADALDRILTELAKQGYSFVTVSDLIYKENYTIDHTGRQINNK